MKTCEDYIADMNLSIDGLLSPEEEQALQAHLADCPSCRNLYRSYREIQDAIDEAEVEPPKGLRHSVMTQIREEKVRHSPKGVLKRMRFTLVAAVIALVVVSAGKYIGTPHGSTAASSEMETAAAAEAAEAAEPAEPADTAPDEGTAFAAAPQGVPENADTAEAAEEAAEEAAPVEEYAENDAPMVGAANPETADTSDTMLIIWSAMQQEGYVGNLYAVDTTENALFALLPQAEIHALSSGDIIYSVSASDYQLVQSQLPAVQEIDSDTQSDTVYLCLASE